MTHHPQNNFNREREYHSLGGHPQPNYGLQVHPQLAGAYPQQGGMHPQNERLYFQDQKITQPMMHPQQGGVPFNQGGFYPHLGGTPLQQPSLQQQQRNIYQPPTLPSVEPIENKKSDQDITQDPKVKMLVLKAKLESLMPFQFLQCVAFIVGMMLLFINYLDFLQAMDTDYFDDSSSVNNDEADAQFCAFLATTFYYIINLSITLSTTIAFRTKKSNAFACGKLWYATLPAVVILTTDLSDTISPFVAAMLYTFYAVYSCAKLQTIFKDMKSLEKEAEDNTQEV